MPVITVRRTGDGRLTASGDLSWAAGEQICRRNGDSDGIYAGWRWDGRTLAVDNDRYGFYPLFAWTTPDSITLASGLDELLKAGAPAVLDYDALAVFLRLGFFLDADTPFLSIRAVDARALIRWDDRGPSLEGARPRPAVQAMPRRHAIDALNSAFSAAIARRLVAGAFQMPLSGGRDSRHILFSLIDADRPPEACVTVPHYPPRGNDDIAVAAALCRRLGIRHIVLRQRRDRAAAEREKNLRTHLCTDEHGQFVPLAAHLRATSAASYDGIAGDVLSQSSYLTPQSQASFAGGDVPAIAAFLLAGGTNVSERALERLLAPAILREVPRERALARLERELPRHLGAPNPVGSFFFWNRTRREIALAPYGLMAGLTMHAPYLDRDVYDLLASLPAHALIDRRLHSEAIAIGWPQHADIPYEARQRRAAAPWLQRRVAASVGAALWREPGMLQAPALLPGVLATLVDGNPSRLWHTSLSLYLAQLAATSRIRASGRAAASVT